MGVLEDEYILIVTYTPGCRQQPLRKQLYDQPLLRNYSTNNDLLVNGRSTQQRNGVFLCGPSDATLRTVFYVGSDQRLYQDG
jgi:hypothetical protein